MNAVRPAPLPPAAAQRMHAAVAAQQRGDYVAAEADFQELTRRFPQFPDAWHFYGLQLHQRGEKDLALEMLVRAQGLDPDNFIFLLNFGRVLYEQGQVPRAIELLQRAHALKPDHAQTLVSLTQCLLAADCGGEMTAEVERHLAWAGDNWRLWSLLGECREQGGDRAGALNAYAEACRIAPRDDPVPHIMRGQAARRDSRYDTARESFQTALRIDPASAGATLGLAQLAAQEGDFERAEEVARDAIRLDPDLLSQSYAAWELLSTIRPRTPGRELAEEMDAAAARAGANPNVWLLHFARARVRERIGDYEQAFAAYDMAHRSRSEGRGYSREAQVKYTRDVLDNLDRGFTRRNIAADLPDPGVIFICGMPRSGTTLLETILASHPTVSAGGELRHIHDRLVHTLGMTRMNQSGSWLRARSDAELAEIARDWRESLIAPAAGHPRVTDKLPGNYSILGLVHLCFPDAPIVHVRRDARDNGFSCFATAFAEGNAFASSLQNIGHYYRLYECFMNHWRDVLGAERIIEVEYEKLVRNPEPEIRRLVAAVGLEWDPRCLDFHKTARDVRTASVFQVRQPLYTSSIGRWRHFERHLGPLIDELQGPTPL